MSGDGGQNPLLHPLRNLDRPQLDHEAVEIVVIVVFALELVMRRALSRSSSAAAPRPSSISASMPPEPPTRP